MQLFLTAFVTIFLAELGDKTQIATVLFSADKDQSKWIVFLGAALALIATSAIGVALGGTIAQFFSERTLKTVGGIGFLLVGAWTLLSK